MKEQNKSIDIVYCKECVHRPKIDRRRSFWIRPPNFKDGRIDTTCPFICEDPFYSDTPPGDYFYCAFGQRKEKEKEKEKNHE